MNKEKPNESSEEKHGHSSQGKEKTKEKTKKFEGDSLFFHYMAYLESMEKELIRREKEKAIGKVPEGEE